MYLHIPIYHCRSILEGILGKFHFLTAVKYMLTVFYLKSDQFKGSHISSLNIAVMYH